jgi:DNA-binding transcriptional MerR regulator
MTEYSQITFDFFTPPTSTVKKSLKTGQEEEMAITDTSSAASGEVVEVIFPEQVAVATDTTEPAIQETEAEADEIEPASIAIAPGVKSTRGRKSLKSFALAADLVNVPEDDILFQKQYYSIGEVSAMFQVNASLLRFWESEFDIIQPRKNRKGDRHFRPIDIKNLQLIYDLLRRRKLTIEGAKDFLKRNSKAKERFETIQNLRKIRSFLAELKGSL